MALTVKEIEHAKPRAKKYKLYDEHNLCLIVYPNGGGYFRFRYRRPGNGKQNWISLGTFPEVTLAKAREARDAARNLLSQGIDPSQDRKAKKLDQAVAAANDFESVAREWLGKKTYSKSKKEDITRNFEKRVFPLIGSLPISEIKPPQVVAVLKPVDEAGKYETAHQMLGWLGKIFRYGMATGRCPVDPTRDIRDALTPRDPRNHAAITDPKEVGRMLRLIDEYWGEPAVCDALKLSPYLFTRPGELRNCMWADIDLDAAEWRFTLSKRKPGQQKRELIVSLCRQAVQILRNRKEHTGTSPYVSPSVKTPNCPISDGTINSALRILGIPKETMCGQGFRAMAETLILEKLRVPKYIVELQLGHLVKDPNGTAYDRAAFLDDRRKMMQDWADLLDGLKAGTNR
jgi:integrase